MQLNITPVVRNLLIINVLIFFGEQLFQVTNIVHFYGGLYSFESPRFLPFQVVTHLFLHDTRSLWHLFGNMISLLIFGPKLEEVWGSRRFVFFYFFCGVGAALMYSGVETYRLLQIRNDAQVYMQHPTPARFNNFISKHNFIENHQFFYESEEFYHFSNEFEQNPTNPTALKTAKEYVSRPYAERVNGSAIGASGAIFGLLLAFGLLFPTTIIYFNLFFPIQARFFVLIMGGIEVFRLIQQDPNDNVGHLSHLSGMLFAFILIRIWRKKRDTFY